MKIGRHEHHVLASMIASREAEGRPVSDVEASGLIGYSPYTICNLRRQKAFQELVEHYAGRVEPPPQPDSGSRMQALGISVLEELQERLADDPDGWTKRELLDMADLLLIKAANMRENARIPAVTGGQGVHFSINFVESRRPKELEAPVADHMVIEAEMPGVAAANTEVAAVDSPVATSEAAVAPTYPAALGD